MYVYGVYCFYARLRNAINRSSAARIMVKGEGREEYLELRYAAHVAANFFPDPHCLALGVCYAAMNLTPPLFSSRSRALTQAAHLNF